MNPESSSEHKENTLQLLRQETGLLMSTSNPQPQARRAETGCAMQGQNQRLHQLFDHRRTGVVLRRVGPASLSRLREEAQT
jgi:hypothetical protein